MHYKKDRKHYEPFIGKTFWDRGVVMLADFRPGLITYSSEIIETILKRHPKNKDPIISTREVISDVRINYFFGTDGFNALRIFTRRSTCLAYCLKYRRLTAQAEEIIRKSCKAYDLLKYIDGADQEQYARRTNHLKGVAP